MKNVKEPKTLQEAIVTFADPDNALWYMVSKRWPDGVVCPTCGRTDVNFLAEAAPVAVQEQAFSSPVYCEGWDYLRRFSSPAREVVACRLDDYQ